MQRHNWRKSSYSGSQGGNCVEAGSWRKSSYSGPTGGNCVEAGNGDSRVGIRDTQLKEDSPVLEFSLKAWRSFLGTLR